jgi:O-antigen biosynthesis protein WbqV
MRLKKIMGLMFDLGVTFISYGLSSYLTKAYDLWPQSQNGVIFLGIYSIVSFFAVLLSRTYQSIWRYISLKDLLLIAKTVVFINMIVLFLSLLIQRFYPIFLSVPLSFVITNGFVLLVLLGGPRFTYRIFKNRVQEQQQGKGALVIGTGNFCDLFLRSNTHSLEPYSIQGIIDPEKDTQKKNSRFHGYPILGSLIEIEEIVEKVQRKDHKVDVLIIAEPTLFGNKLVSLLEFCEKNDIKTMRVSGLNQIETNGMNSVEVRPIRLEDLLGRPPREPNLDLMKPLIKGRRIMITGAGGSIGSEIVRQVVSLNPEKVILVDSSEYLLYLIDLEMEEKQAGIPWKSYLGDVTDETRMSQIIQKTRPHIVFHAAALKHVPLSEINPNEALRTNVIGTRNVAEACRENEVEAMILISTDKAVNPTSLMGASKRMAEIYCQSLDIIEKKRTKGTRYITVRFGNVLGSAGSVVPLFQRQISYGGPVKVTHPDMVRYFMTIKEAVMLVIQAGALGIKDKEYTGKIFVLDMGEPVRILDMARQMIRLNGLIPEKDIEIEFTGMRVGEKLYEELFYQKEDLQQTEVEGLLAAKPLHKDYINMVEYVRKLKESTSQRDTPLSLHLLKDVVEEYHGYLL